MCVQCASSASSLAGSVGSVGASIQLLIAALALPALRLLRTGHSWMVQRFRSGGRRLVPLVLAPTLVVVGLALPVIPRAVSEPVNDPIEPTLVALPLTGLDAGALRESAVAMASWEDLTHDHAGERAGTTAVTPLGLAPLPGAVAQQVSDPDAHSGELQSEVLEPAIATAPMATDAFGLVGVTADAPLDPATRVLVRVREDGRWGSWYPLPVTEHGPDPLSAEAEGARYGTDPLLVDDADGVQVRIDAPADESPVNPQVMLLDNPTTPVDAALAEQGPAVPTASLPGATAQAATVTAPVPVIITREQWGADETLRTDAPRYSPTIKAAFVHHTTSKSEYTPEEAVQQVRNLYGWYVKGLRYSDMAYNFLVDRYGRLYEGRAGGMDQAVVGAHTAGFNNETFAISAIGNFEKVNPPPEQMAAMTNSISSLLAWKLSTNHRDPNGTQILVSDSGAGTSKYAPGSQATALVVGGHKDIGATKCPGQFLETQLPAIRSAAAAMMGATIYDPTVSAPVPWGSADALTVNTRSTAPLSWNLSIASRCGTVVRTIGGRQDAAGPLSITWDKRDGNGNPVPPGTYTFTLTADAAGDAIYPWTGIGVITPSAGSPQDPCGPPETFTLVGSGYGHGIGMSQWGAYAMAKEGRDATGILTHYYTGTTVSAVPDETEVRVNLRYQIANAQMRSEAVAPDGGAIEVTVGGNVVVGGPQDTFAFSVNGASVAVQRTSQGQTTDLGSAPTVAVRWAGTRNPGSASGGTTLLNLISGQATFDSPGHRYRYGSIEVSAVTTSSGVRMNVVNLVRLHDEYLYGISEVSSSWPAAALQAQAIAARTYALAKITKSGVRKACSCHVDDGTGPYIDQTFTGFAKQSGAKGGKWVEAVDATAASPTTGLAVLYNGEPISAFYSSSSGGATNSTKEVWGGDLPYTVSVPDQWSLHPDNPHRSWTATISQAQMAKAFQAPAVWKIEVTQRLTSGAVGEVRATMGDGTTRALNGEQLRSALGLKSAYVTSIDGASGVAAPLSNSGAGAVTGQPQPEAESAAATDLRVTLRIGPTTTPKAGSKLIFRGKVRPKADAKGVRVERQRLIDGVWTTVAKTRTNAKGRYRFRVKQAVPAGSVFEYRIVVVRKGQIIAISDEVSVEIRGRKKPQTRT
jgi:SpoIID/LytB domain protein